MAWSQLRVSAAALVSRAFFVITIFGCTNDLKLPMSGIWDERRPAITIGSSMSLDPSSKTRREAKNSRPDKAVARVTIGEMARTFDVSLRTLRFYEDRGLLVPHREGTARFYAAQDKMRLEAILRLKHLGFTLTEIRDMILDSDKRPASTGVTLRPEQVSAQLAHLERQRQEIDGAILALRNVQSTMVSA